MERVIQDDWRPLHSSRSLLRQCFGWDGGLFLVWVVRVAAVWLIWETVVVLESKDLLFYTGATNFFHNYIPLYFLFGALEHPGASFEFLVRDLTRMQALHGESLDRIQAWSGSVYYLHDVATRQCRKIPLMENSYRFLLQPFLRSEYIYIGDIDVLLTENVLERHHAYLDSGLPFYNHIRPGTKRLTGLHLARYDHLYPLDPTLWDFCHLNDEEILYKRYELMGCLCQAELAPLVNDLGRPNCGIHVSPNRLPFFANVEGPDWGMEVSTLRRLLRHLECPEVRSIVEVMYRGSRRILMNLVVISRGLQSINRSDRLLYLLKKKEIWVDS
ncbi:MAG: hypothetical protein ACPG6X_03010 [Synechococcus sp.]